MNLIQKMKHTLSLDADSSNGNGKMQSDILQLLLDTSTSALAYININYFYEYVNKAYANWFGATPAEIIGKSVRKFIGAEAFQQVRHSMEKAMEGEETQNAEKTPVVNGSRFIEERYTPHFDEYGKVKGCVALIIDHAEKGKTGKEISKKQTELQDYVDNATIGLHWVNSRGIIIWANKTELNMLGYSAEEYIGHHISEFHCSQEIINDILTRLACKEIIHQYEADLKCKDGSIRTVLINSNVLWENGKFIHTRCFTTDITEKKKLYEAEHVNARKKLLDRDANYQQLIGGLPVALYTCDIEGRVILYNKAAVELWGREPEIGKDMWCGSWKIYEPDGITQMALDKCPMAITLKEGRAVKGVEIIIECPDGTKKYVQPNPVPMFDTYGKMTGAVNMLVDITENKIVEQKLASLAAIVESSDDAIIGKTLDGIVTSWNKAAEKVFGYTANEMIGQAITNIIPPDRLNEEPKLIERLKKGESVDHFDTKRKTKDGKLIDISLTISPIKDKHGKVIGASKISRDITIQKRLNETLRESEERLRMAIESTKLGTWEYHPQSGNLSWSDECRKIYDVPENMEVDFQFFSDHIYPEDAEFAQTEIAKAMGPEGNGHYDIQYRILRYSDKQPRWIRAQGKVYFNAADQPERFIGTVLDITEDKNQEQQLKDSVELFTIMAENVPAMIWMSGTDKFGDYFNNTWLTFTGRTLEQECNEGWLENIHPDDVKKCIDNYNQSYNVQKGSYTEYRLKRHDGQYRWIADNAVPRYDSDGLFNGFISACMDIDDQKRFREKIQESELHFKTISNVAPVGLWMTDTNAQNIFVNDTWIQWTGIPFEKQLGVGWLDRVLEEDKVGSPGKFWDCLMKREKYSSEFRIKKPGEEIRWCLTEGSPYYNIAGEFAGYAGSVTDITQIRKLEERKDDFIKMASHELKTPITSIKGYVQLLLNIYNEMDNEKLQFSKATVKSSLGTISKQVTKLTRLISELLDLSRIESGKLELHKTKFNLADMVEETVEDVRHTTSRHAIIIQNDFEGKIYADKDRLSQVLLNLLTNAIKYSPDADSIEVYVEGNNEQATIKVKDHGIGIARKDHLKIFERFYRVEGKSEQTFPGFGIGLFIATEIIQRHQGMLTVESEKSKGATFTITLPVKTAKQEE